MASMSFFVSRKMIFCLKIKILNIKEMEEVSIRILISRFPGRFLFEKYPEVILIKYKNQFNFLISAFGINGVWRL